MRIVGANDSKPVDIKQRVTVWAETEGIDSIKFTAKVLMIELSDLSRKLVSICGISVKTDKPRVRRLWLSMYFHDK